MIDACEDWPLGLQDCVLYHRLLLFSAFPTMISFFQIWSSIFNKFLDRSCMPDGNGAG